MRDPKELRSVDDIANEIKKRRRDKAAGVVTVENHEAKERSQREAALVGGFVGELASREAPFIGRALLGFRCVGDVWRAEPQRPFYPCGLMIFGDVPAGAMLELAVIGQQMQVMVSSTPVPAKFFSTWRSYEQLAKAVDEGLEPPGWCTWDIVHVGYRVEIRLGTREGKPLDSSDGVDVAMWGETIL